MKWFCLVLLIAVCSYEYARTRTADQDPYLITDYSRLHPVKVERVTEGREVQQLIRILQEAKDKRLTVSIAGQRHSQGGHTYYKDGIVIDMKTYNNILSFDPSAKVIRVQAGATWKDVQDKINPYGLAVKTMQSQNIFTIGGSISINAHGRDLHNGSLINSVESFRLLTAGGEIKNVSRTENKELFSLALGGYGLFGIILDVTLTLTEDEVYRMTTEATSVQDYSCYFKENILLDGSVRMSIARISVAPEGFLTDMYAMNYRKDPGLPLAEHHTLKEYEQGVIPSKIMFHVNRSSDWGKNLFWSTQKLYFNSQQNVIVSRNNAMRSESAFMEYRGTGTNDLLQEYFIPVDEFAGFVADMRSVLLQENLNLLNISVRFVQKDEEAVLSYAREDMFALVCLFNVPLSDKEQAKIKPAIQKIIQEVIRHRGTYYLPYAAYPTQTQFQTVYPRQKEFFEGKDRYDPEHLFMNYFYEQYRGDGNHE
ncbi:FAD-binding oxidoreductase [Paenibacillus sp. FJAT-26967]|uniref:FAD-binding oxidoreductase n=1 Tax=Paenibacillus sp. FJAT-26967 TaxID=1729690 RepID=UPI000837BF57|nr:FAD-binding oxidoreductase [Paenibacillus sp. FJAT-26967]